MQAINVGAVSTRPKSKLHYAVNGRSYCGAGSGWLIGPARQLVADGVKILCRRCVKAVREAIQETIHEVMRRRNTAALRILNAVADALRTPAEVRAEEQTLAEIASAIKTSPSGRWPRSFADLRMLHLGAIERDKAERHGQLELCEVAS